MAEFVEVMRQAYRMCNARSCSDCPMCNMKILDGCELVLGEYYADEELLKIEQTVIQWMKEHPEPQYPTWKEWQRENFPDAPMDIEPCSFADSKHLDCQHDCNTCMHRPIPADIAKKLGIRPKEV